MGRLYDTRRWRRLRLQHLRQNPLCGPCGKRGVTKAATDVDHIVAIAKGGAGFDRDNLQSLCHDCHSRKTAMDAGKVVALGCDTDGRPMDPRHCWNTKTPCRG